MKTCIITGANYGIGKAAAVQIAQKGYKVILAVRNKISGKKAISEIKNIVKNCDLELCVVDLSSKKSIFEFVKNIKNKIEVLDVLIHNAVDFVIGRNKPVYSTENIETVWATNHIAPVLT
jgi:NAD(P)-dependent dehydrogenase (short-subunit alcohol dehydrogenase family)